MGNSWEYKVLTLKREEHKFFATTPTPDDDESTRIINREGNSGWELVSAVALGTAFQPPQLRLFFKRAR